MHLAKRLLVLVLLFSFLLIPSAASAASNAPDAGCNGTAGPCVASSNFTNPITVPVTFKLSGVPKITVQPGQSSPAITVRADRFVTLKLDKVKNRTLVDLTCSNTIFIVKKNIKKREFRLFIPGGVTFNCKPVYL